MQLGNVALLRRCYDRYQRSVAAAGRILRSNMTNKQILPAAVDCNWTLQFHLQYGAETHLHRNHFYSVLKPVACAMNVVLTAAYALAAAADHTTSTNITIHNTVLYLLLLLLLLLLLSSTDHP